MYVCMYVYEYYIIYITYVPLHSYTTFKYLYVFWHGSPPNRLLLGFSVTFLVLAFIDNFHNNNIVFCSTVGITHLFVFACNFVFTAIQWCMENNYGISWGAAQIPSFTFTNVFWKKKHWNFLNLFHFVLDFVNQTCQHATQPLYNSFI